MGPALRHLPGALLEPTATLAQIEINGDNAIIRNGAIAAHVRLEPGDIRGGAAQIRFLHAATGVELLAEAPSHFPKPPARLFKPVGGDHFHVQARFKAYDDERIGGK